MNKNQWLCFNCVYSGNCLTESQAKSPILYCDEHYSKGSDKKPLVSNKNQTDITNHMGLCSTCDHEKYCSLKAKTEITINCEHYQ